MILTSISGISSSHAVGDVELMHELRSGKTEAFETLFCRYVRLVYRVATGILKDKAEAEDVTQEIFLEVYRKACLYDPARGSVRTWLLQYAYHRALRRKASLRRRAAYGGESIDRVDTAEQGSRHRLTRTECRWVLRAGLAQLPDQQRTTLELTCFEELTLRDVAERLGVSIGCTRHYYYRGLARLQAWARLLEERDTRPRLAERSDRRAVTTRSRDASGGDTADGVKARGRLRFVPL